MISKQLANQIVEQTMLRLHRNINVVHTNGMILASGDRLRVESIHGGARIVAKTEKALIITEENNHLFQNAKPGINLPIFFQNELVGVIGITGNPDDIVEVATLVQLTTEMMVHQALIASQSEWKRKMRETIFQDLMNQQPLQKVMEERLYKIGFFYAPPFYAITLDVEATLMAYQSFVEHMEDFFIHESVIFGRYQLNEHFILVSGMDTKAIKRKITMLLTQLKKYFNVRIGIGQPVQSLEKASYSYETAKNAIEYGDKKKSIIFFEEVEIFSLLKKSDSQEALHFTSRVLKDLNNKLIHTLVVYFSNNQQLTICSEELGIHRHTLTYRLNQIHETTGYDPANFQDAIILQIALWLKNK
ncbi:helix-turn-helix domain-containing protein [Viridibacillus sp. YIM B01967]|uniref:Helix-turn-helix domain-containing protein n=1 Tax=Viridibacillus soli TaxID=2798301 RepID=A0ABS1H9E5_9BACL|nr:sugar diacid recognition domain-containing protein [Viridibacillus soli]MBK3495936.1 helix-turn-helix domain-containing protein [Viridibacillus soli]